MSINPDLAACCDVDHKSLRFLMARETRHPLDVVIPRDLSGRHKARKDARNEWRMSAMTRMRLIAVIFAAAIASLAAAHAAKPEVYTGRFSSLAVDGYDPVAYFEENAPVKGSKELSFEYNGATWLFSSSENLASFKDDPQKYAPQYGGYCAWAVSQGYTARGNPKNWTIHEGRLYLNFNDKVQADWLKDVPEFVEKADANWPAVLER